MLVVMRRRPTSSRTGQAKGALSLSSILATAASTVGPGRAARPSCAAVATSLSVSESRPTENGDGRRNRRSPASADGGKANRLRPATGRGGKGRQRGGIAARRPVTLDHEDLAIGGELIQIGGEAGTTAGAGISRAVANGGRGRGRCRRCGGCHGGEAGLPSGGGACGAQGAGADLLRAVQLAELIVEGARDLGLVQDDEGIGRAEEAFADSDLVAAGVLGRAFWRALAAAGPPMDPSARAAAWATSGSASPSFAVSALRGARVRGGHRCSG